MPDFWFRDDLKHALDSEEQAIRRDKSGDKQAGALEVIADLRVLFGLNDKAARPVLYDLPPEQWKAG